ncbi:MAG: hypothetical protein V1796_03035 [Pseudomonadota bacterium]
MRQAKACARLGADRLILQQMFPGAAPCYCDSRRSAFGSSE